MNLTNLMKDPFYSRIMYPIEHEIHRLDANFKSNGFTMTDSVVKSVYRKLINEAKGKEPKFKEKLKLRETCQKEAYISLMRVKDKIISDGISAKDWCLSLRCVEDSLKTRTSDEPGCRYYLDFLERFILRGEIY